MHDYDALVIGSGAGGMTAALALARAGKSVLLLEQHYLPGGWCHSFSLEGYRFSPGVHYIGELHEGGMMRKLYEGLGVANDLTFFELNPEGYDRVLVDGERFDIPQGWDRFRERLQARFPSEAAGIGKFLGILESVARDLGELMKMRGPLDLLKLPVKARHLAWWGLRSLDAVLDSCGIRDQRVRTILTVQGGDYALPPSQTVTAMHAGILGHYARGGYYPKGGGGAIPAAFLRALRRHGGEVRVRASVEKILLRSEGGKQRALGVRLADGTEIHAPLVISNADPGVTFGKLVGHEHLSPKLRKKLSKTTWSISALSLFCATDMDLEEAGLDSGNIWFMQTPDQNAFYRQANSPECLENPEFPGLFITVTTLKDRTKRKKGHHTVEAFSFVSHQAFEQWANSKTGERPSGYEHLKAELQEKMVRTLDKAIPGIAKRLVFQELGTPLTNNFYVAATGGSLYGTEKLRGQLGPFSFPLQTEIPGLYLCGASTVSHGVAGATMSGVMVASKALNCSPREFLDATGQSITLYSADDTSGWPEKLKQQAKRGSAPTPVGV